MTELIVLGSTCPVSEYFMEKVIEAADETGIAYTIREVVNAYEVEKWGVVQGCMFGYCPGCHSVASEYPDQKFTPALVVNGKVKIHGGFPGKESIKDTLKNM